MLGLRKDKKLSRETLGAKIGVSKTAIKNWEDDENAPKLEYLQLLSDYFKKNGEYREIIETRTGRSGKTKTYKGVLSVAKVSVNDELYENLQWILQYYLETAFFAPDASHIDLDKRFGSYLKRYKPVYDKEGNIPKRIVCDYIAGMTDGYALSAFKQIKIPKPIKFK